MQIEYGGVLSELNINIIAKMQLWVQAIGKKQICVVNIGSIRYNTILKNDFLR